MRALLLAAALVAATAGAARADHPRPVAPLGWRFGGGTVSVDGDPRVAFALGLARGTSLAGVRVTGEYTVEFLAGTSGMSAAATGTGHHFRALARHELWGVDLRKGHIYLDVELGGGALLAFDSVAGRTLTPSAIAGIRVGAEAHASGPSPSRTMDGMLTIRLATDGDALGLMVATGMDFGR